MALAVFAVAAVIRFWRGPLRKRSIADWLNAVGGAWLVEARIQAEENTFDDDPNNPNCDSEDPPTTTTAGTTPNTTASTATLSSSISPLDSSFQAGDALPARMLYGRPMAYAEESIRSGMLPFSCFSHPHSNIMSVQSTTCPTVTTAVPIA